MYKIDGEIYLERDEVKEVTKLKQSVIYEKMRYNVFPQPCRFNIPVQITVQRSRSLWKKSEIDAYVAKEKEADHK